MITFTHHQARKIEAGRQTRTTRLGERRWALGGVHEVRAGRQGRVICYIRIVGLQLIRLGTITDEEARSEGFADLRAMQYHWQQTYGAWDPATEAWAVQFIKVPDPERYRQTDLFERKGDAQ